ncbi:MAG: Iron-sulfur cluster assembly protein SufD, partial [uncultured Solirubrobacteraceae bacterium]
DRHVDPRRAEAGCRRADCDRSSARVQGQGRLGVHPARKARPRRAGSGPLGDRRRGGPPPRPGGRRRDLRRERGRRGPPRAPPGRRDRAAPRARRRASRHRRRGGVRAGGAQRRPLDRRRVRLRAAQRRPRRADPDHQRPRADGHRALHAHARRPRRGCGGRGLGSDPVGGRGDRGPRERRRGARRGPQRAAALRRRAGGQRADLGLRHPARGRGARRPPRLGDARLRRQGRQGLPRDQARRSRRPRGRHGRLRDPGPSARRLRHAAGARGGQHDERPRVPRNSPRPLDGGLARDDPGRPGRPADRRVPGVPQPAALQEGARGRDPRPGDPRRRRALHPRRGDRPDRPGAAVLFEVPRPAGGGRAPAGRRGFPRCAARALRRGPGPGGGRRRAGPSSGRGARL